MMGFKRYVSLAVLVFVHTVTFMDRYTLAGVLTLTQDYFQINNAMVGLTQTVFVISLTILSPLFGYLGDRFDRRYIMAVGISIAAGVTLAGSFVDKKYFWLFVTSRALVGIGEASFSTVAPAIITDLYVGGQRSLALAIFYLCVPFGSGLGYIIGSNVAHLAGDHWQWAFRVTPGLGIIGVIFILVVLDNPNRGQAEGHRSGETTSWSTDLKEIFKVWSCVWTYIAMALVTFTAGAVAFWYPTMVYNAMLADGMDTEQTRVSLVFGIFTCVAGIVGVIAGAEAVRRYRSVNPRSDAVITGGLMILSGPFLFISIYLAGKYTIPMWGLFFITEILLCSSFSVQTDIILSVVLPTRRSTAAAIAIMSNHILGDASSPYIIGTISDKIFVDYKDIHSTVMNEYLSLNYAMYTLCFVAVLAGGAYLMVGITLEQDRARVRAIGYMTLDVDIKDDIQSKIATDEENINTSENPMSQKDR